MKKIFRIVRNNLSKEAEKSFHPYRYRIEVRHTILFFVHWWSTPEFEPPHNFEFAVDAYNCIKEHCPNSIVYSLFVQKNWKPSEEQIEALKEACDEHWEPDGLDPLYILWEQLKKLREE